jgi:hypothetical protein
VAAFLWLSTLQRATVYFLSGLTPSEAANLHGTPLSGAEEIQELLPDGVNCLMLPDADRTLVEVGTASIRATESVD